MNTNLSATTNDDSYTVENLLLRALEDALPDLCIVTYEDEIDVRDGAADEDCLLDWHYPGRNNVSNMLPEVDFTDNVRVNQGLSTPVRRSHLVARGLFANTGSLASM
ncbi:hypothetical protein BH10CYA1_BH10CYA1_09710 [soil metagenome]